MLFYTKVRHSAYFFCKSWFPPGLENLEKQEGIFQSGIFVKTGKVREFYSKYWKNYTEKQKKILEKSRKYVRP